MKRGPFSPIAKWIPKGTSRDGRKQITVSVGPWKGARSLGDAGQQEPKFLYDAINCLFADSRNGGAVFARPGFVRNTLAGSGMTDSSGLTTQIRGLHGVRAGGSHQIFAFQGGRVYRHASGTTWTNVTPAGVEVGITGNGNHVESLSYNGEVIVNQCLSGQEPWRMSSLTATPVIGTNILVDTAASNWSVRSMTIYGGKLFFVVDAIASTTYESRLVWSEELDAATGYMQDGFTNFWDVVPSSTDRIHQIVGTNEALYYFRQNSIGAILGAVNATFQTSHTDDSVSHEVGSHSRCQPIVAKGYIWFVTQNGLIHRFRSGSRDVEEIWKQLRTSTFATQDATYNISSGPTALFPLLAYCHDVNKVVALLFADTDNSIGARYLNVFDADTGNYEGRWYVELASQPTNETPSAVPVCAIASMPQRGEVDGFGNPALMVAGALPGTSTYGHVWRQTLRATQTFGDNSAAMHQSISTMLTPDEENVEVKVDEVAIEVVPDTTAVSLDYYAPRGSSTGLTMSGTASADSIQSSYDHGIQRIGLGEKAFGRWFRAVFWKNVAAGSTPHAFEKATYKIKAHPANPNSP